MNLVNKSRHDELVNLLNLAEDNSKKIRPPLKWAGGKYSILDEIKAKLPAGNRLIEPFAGSGVVFLNTKYERYTLNDKNKDLIGFYKILKRDGETFIDYCREYFRPDRNNADEYYKLRNKFNSSEDIVERSALFLYINKHGYNGLCRYNSSGGLNVPFGRYNGPFFPEQSMRLFWKKSKKASLTSSDFEKVMISAKEGDVIYCDPPYVPLSKTSNFTSYSAGGFDAHEHERLAETAEKVARKGVAILISNHYTKFTRSIYSGARTSSLSVRRLISCNGSKRENAKEILALYLPL